MKDNTSYVNEAVISYTPKKISDDKISGPETAEAFLRSVWNKQIALKESFYVVAVNGNGVPVSYYLASIGGIRATVVEVTDVLRFLILSGADRFFIAHNHPSGYEKESRADIAITKKINESAKIMGIELMDHLILMPGNGFISMAERGLI